MWRKMPPKTPLKGQVFAKASFLCESNLFPRLHCGDIIPVNQMDLCYSKASDGRKNLRAFAQSAIDQADYYLACMAREPSSLNHPLLPENVLVQHFTSTMRTTSTIRQLNPLLERSVQLSWIPLKESKSTAECSSVATYYSNPRFLPEARRIF